MRSPGDVATALEVLESALDPQEGIGLSRYARDTAKKYGRIAFLREVEETLGPIWGTSPGGKIIKDSEAEGTKYDHLTGQIKTGHIATVILEVLLLPPCRSPSSLMLDPQPPFPRPFTPNPLPPTPDS